MDFFKLLERYYGFDLKKAGKVVFVRHQLMDYEHDFASDIVKHIGEYACIQRKENPPKNNKPSPNHGARFWGCNTVVSFCYPKFYGETGRHARFVGIFRNHSGDLPEPLDTKKHLHLLPLALTEIYREQKNQLYFFDLRKIAGFEDLEGRAVVNWAYGQNWVQEFRPIMHNELEIREVLPRELELPQ